MRPNWRSRGVATAEAMVSGLAPGRPEVTFIVGKSTCGRGETGRKRKATMPARAMAMVIREVATGRRINGAEKLADIMAQVTLPLVTASGLFDGVADMQRKAAGQPIKRQINDGRGVKREQLA